MHRQAGSLDPSHLGSSVFVVPEDARLAVEEKERLLEEDVDRDLLGCCRKDLMAGCVPLLPLL